MFSVLARNWWAFALRGALAIAFGLVVFAFPGAALLSFALLFAGYSFADGIFAIIGAVRSASAGQRWGMLAFEGVLSLVVGAAAFAWPGLTIFVFVLLIGVRALFAGGMMLATSFKVDAAHGRLWLALGGIVSLFYGLVLIATPMVGALVLTWWLGAYAVVFGVMLLILAFRLRARHVGGGSRRPV